MESPDLTLVMKFTSEWSVNDGGTFTWTPFNITPVSGTGTWDSSLLTFTVPTTALPNDTKFSDKNNNELSIPSSVNTPTYGGVFIVEIIFYDTSTTTATIQYHQTEVLTISGKDWTATSWFSYSRNVDKYTVLECSITPADAIPASDVPSDITLAWGQIHLAFDISSTHFESDLGTGLSTGDVIPCRAKSGLVPLTGATDVVCTLETNINNRTHVIVTGFQAVSAGTVIEI